MKKNTSLKIGKSLFEFSEKKSLGKKIFTELEALVKLFEAKDLQTALKRLNMLEPEQLKNIIEKMFEGKLEKSLENILVLLIKRREIQLLPEILEVYRKLYFKRHKIADVTVVAARELDEELKKTIIGELESGEFTEIHKKFLVNPELIGGVQIYKNNFLTDLSVKTYLEKLKHHLTSHEYVI